MKNIFIVFLLFNVPKYVTLSDIEVFSNRVVLTSIREDDPDKWFDKENPQFQYIGQLWIGETRYIKAKIRQTNTKEKISFLSEDPDVEILRRKQEISWVEQEKFQTRMRRTLDPEWPNLWYLNDEVSPSLKVSAAWNAGYSGKGVIIAVVDDGLETDHPDISANVDAEHGISFRDGATDPKPKSDKDDHGTSVTGLIAAVRDNNICIPGVAYNSTVIGVQLLGTHDNINNTVDSDAATAFLHYVSNVDIYSNSWGPIEGSGFSGPGYLAKKALRNGVTTGRNGKGAIYIFSAGNGGLDDNCNADGYANSIYTIAITSVQIDENAWYSEVCAPALAATYGGSKQDQYLTTTKIKSGCTNEGIQGTSFSAPIASAIIAMTLEANPNLTWRDIQHLVVLTSNRKNFIDTFSDWSTNGANQEFSQVLGFGLMNAETMVSVGSQWKSVPQQHTCASRNKFPYMTTTSTKSDLIDITVQQCSAINYLEHVQVIVTFSYTRYRGGTQLYLISPAGTKSNLLHHRKEDAEDNLSAGNLNWTYMSVHFWGESPIGNWTLQISSTIHSVRVRLDRWSLRFYGTTTDPWQTAIYRVVLVIETSAYQSSDITTLNNPSSDQFKDVKAGLGRYWSTMLGTSFYSTAINRLTPTEKGYIIVDQKVYTNENSVGSLIKSCYDLVNSEESLRFGRFLSLKVSTINITNYEVPDSTVEISNLTQTNELCSIRTTLSPCSSKLKCKVLNGKPSCVSKSSASTGAIIGGVLGSIATALALAGAFYLYWKQRRE
ncbi:furin-like protease kpc-1 isoform X2 [Mytilus californianus]|uniref:furin-like protease kpc-1 isoform X2 n=1 Tax=Mytilus californianus TaxID=6549 RepID=UPI00224864C4|nr:furin-like protease kpc-1 isoform X2 [Mytilus californianus]